MHRILPFLLSLVIASSAQGQTASYQVSIDRRVELLAIVFRLAGANEFASRAVPQYAAAIDTFFTPFAEHAAVVTARRLRAERQIGWDAVMSYAVHLTDVPELHARMSFEDSELRAARWRPEEAREFLVALQAFARESNAKKFFDQQQPMFNVAVRRLRAVLEPEVDQAWFPAYFGTGPKSNFNLVVAPLNGGIEYGVRFHGGDGRRELYAIMSVYSVDEDGYPTFNAAMAPTVVHEFSHSFVNPAVEKHLPTFLTHADSLKSFVAPEMARIGYQETRTVISESIIRAAVARYKLSHTSPAAAKAELDRQRQKGFLWIGALDSLLADYEKNRKKYPTFESYMPVIAASMQQIVRRMPMWSAEFEALRPKLLHMTPENGSVVDPAVTTISFTFDRTMGPGHTAITSAGQDKFPETTAPHRWDQARRVWTMSVKLKPNYSYEFSLNSSQFSGFASADGIPLKPVIVKFTTGDARE